MGEVHGWRTEVTEIENTDSRVTHVAEENSLNKAWNRKEKYVYFHTSTVPSLACCASVWGLMSLCIFDDACHCKFRFVGSLPIKNPTMKLHKK